MLKAITLWEPYASLFSIGAKVNETRGVRTSHRGDICIHAALKRHEFSPEFLRDVSTAFQKRGIKDGEFPFGCIVAVVDLWDVQPSTLFGWPGKDAPGNVFKITEEEYAFGNYTPGRWIYRTRNLRRLKVPVPCRGAQSIGWTVPPEVEKLVLEQLL